MAEAVADTIDGLVRPLADAAGLDLVAVQVKGSSGRTRIRVLVDRKGGVDVGSCQEVSRGLARLLEEHDPVEGRYTLEVSSPGTDHPLEGQRAFDRVEGRTVRIVLEGRAEEAPEGGEGAPAREVVGLVEEALPEGVRVQAADGAHLVPYAEIVKATQVLPW